MSRDKKTQKAQNKKQTEEIPFHVGPPSFLDF
jgi:hypothetical protein